MKSDFLEVKDKIRIEHLATDLLGAPTRSGLYRFPGEKTASIKVYPKSNSFADFGGRACRGGDCIALYASIKGVSQWQALQEIKRIYGLKNEPDKATTSTRQTRSDIAEAVLQERQEQQKAARERAFREALKAEMESLKRRLVLYTEALKRREKEPLSDIWCRLTEAKQAVERKLDILTASDQDTYRKMKPSSEDYKQWKADCAAILRAAGRLPEEGA